MRNKFGVRTVLIPFIAVAGFFFIQMIVAIGYMMILFFVSSFSSAGFDRMKMEQLFADATKVLIAHSNNISGIYSILIIIMALAGIHILKHSNPSAVRRERTNAGQWGAAVLVIIGVSGMITLLMTGIQELAKYVPVVDTALQNYIKLSENFVGSGNILMVILTTCIVVPIAEDLVFRGIIQGELRRVMPAWAAILIQGAIFALVHGDPIQISYVILPAIILGTVYEWTKSIYVPIALHMLFNFLGAALPMMLAGNEKAGNVFVVVEWAVIPVSILAMIFLYKRRRTDPAELPETVNAASLVESNK